jgi:predicted enzyme related to lactoylglutathione lyase
VISIIGVGLAAAQANGEDEEDDHRVPKEARMPGPDELVPGAPAWVDLSTTDVDAASAFYAAVFGWEAEDVVDTRFGGYRVFRLDGKRVGGVGMNTEEDPGPPHWNVFLLTFNAATTTELIGEAGGTVLFEPMVVPTRGVIGMAVDATGAVVGYWQPGVVEGFDLFGEVGSASWFELNASDFDAAERFYAHAFDWSVVRGDDEPRYAAFERNGHVLAGVLDASRMLRADESPSWNVAFGVADVDEAVERAVAAGATVVQPPWDVPPGRRAGLLDPTGAFFFVASATGS